MLQLPLIMSVFRFIASGCGGPAGRKRLQIRGQTPQENGSGRAIAQPRQMIPAITAGF
jgi:hypothetical protein